jgi:hypothetical protein
VSADGAGIDDGGVVSAIWQLLFDVSAWMLRHQGPEQRSREYADAAGTVRRDPGYLPASHRTLHLLHGGILTAASPPI